MIIEERSNMGASCSIDQIDKYKKPELRNVKIRLCGIITEVQHRTNQKGEGYGSFTLTRLSRFNNHVFI